MTNNRNGNLFEAVPDNLSEECFETLAASKGLLIRRIVSTGQATPPDTWLEQHHGEWCVVLSGAAGFRFADEPAARTLGPGDHVLIPARARHRVEWTSPSEPTVWLAVHFD